MTRKNRADPGICFAVEDENGARIQIGWYNETPAGTPFCDRIHVIIESENEEPRGWTMTTREAEHLITGLKYALELVVDNPMPADTCTSDDGCGNRIETCPGNFWRIRE
jgi:hypothetical protein